MSENIELWIEDEDSASLERKTAVEAALEIIRAHSLSDTATNLANNMESLSSYADHIQEALKVK